MKKLIGLEYISKTALSQAIQKLYSCDWSCTDYTNDGYLIDNIILSNDKILTDSEKTTLWNTYLTERESVAALEVVYNKRRIGYGLVEDQLDEIFHNGLDSWKDAIAKVKDDNPKE